MKLKVIFLILPLLIAISLISSAQITERKRPAEWDSLVYGGRFMDRFLPIPVIGHLDYDAWGAPGVIPRYKDNGIESSEWSYWGGNILKGDNGKYHLFVCRWREDSPKGHGEWPNSIVVTAESDDPIGPYRVTGTVGKGHNPEAFRLEDGRMVIYVIDGYYITDEKEWNYDKFEFDRRDRRIIEGLSNLSFAKREDGSYVMVCRGGGIWFSKDGVSPYHQVTDKRVYPDVDGRFEDPVIWRDNVQYNMIVNDWLGRIAYYLRSKDGVNWKVDPGEAYMPGITKYDDGTEEDWFKYERIKILQDEYGRAIQANFAVIDTLKREDKPNDRHSSKNISIPLAVGKLISVLNEKPITSKTKTIEVKLQAEADFNPHQDVDLKSLRFGASEVVNYGGGSELLKTKKSGDDLILVFKGEGHGFTEDNFAGKLLGKTTDGKLLFGFARLPGVQYIEPILSARQPKLVKINDDEKIEIEVQNFGQVVSAIAKIMIMVDIDGEMKELASGEIQPLKPFEKTSLLLDTDLEKDREYKVQVIINPDSEWPVIFNTCIEV